MNTTDETHAQIERLNARLEGLHVPSMTIGEIQRLIAETRDILVEALTSISCGECGYDFDDTTEGCDACVDLKTSRDSTQGTTYNAAEEALAGFVDVEALRY